jgi:trehalose 2-sulfotransferase
MSGYASARFDCKAATSVRKVYVVASSYRSGSSYLCTSLWQTGVLGAPWEYFNYEHEIMRSTMMRLGARSADDYIQKLVTHRTTKNGIFGFKAHFHHFDAALRNFPTLQGLIGKANFIYIHRKDSAAQAVSMAKAIQTSAWLSFAKPRRIPLFYSPDFIQECLLEVERQTEDWRRWFDAEHIRPFIVNYEDLLSDKQTIIDAVKNMLGVQGDAPEEVVLPRLERQSDNINAEWLRRFLADFQQVQPLDQKLSSMSGA